MLYILSKGCTPLISSYNYLEQSKLLFGSQKKKKNLFYNIPNNIIVICKKLFEIIEIIILFLIDYNSYWLYINYIYLKIY